MNKMRSHLNIVIFRFISYRIHFFLFYLRCILIQLKSILISSEDNFFQSIICNFIKWFWSNFHNPIMIVDILFSKHDRMCWMRKYCNFKCKQRMLSYYRNNQADKRTKHLKTATQSSMLELYISALKVNKHFSIFYMHLDFPKRIIHNSRFCIMVLGYIGLHF